MDTIAKELNKDNGTKMPWLTILSAAFILLLAALSFLYLQAIPLNQFCREAGYKSAGKMQNNTICIRPSDENIEYREFQCQQFLFISENCEFTGIQKYKDLRKPADLNLKWGD